MERMMSIAFFAILGLIAIIESRTTTSVVQTTLGPVQGEVLRTVDENVSYSSFKGIPYAEPPLGYLRFKPPVKKQPWSDVHEAFVEGANCIQKDFIYQVNFTGSEDCLYLNVYTPKLDLENTETKPLPVMVWIYGGSFKAGYSNSSLYGPDFIVEEGVVLVTFNYRLGPLGFLNLNHENATGNAGLKDQNLVLRWVRENIAKFGGNSNNVTLFGQSAGGVSVDFHGLSKMSTGLFHRSISMSGSPLCPWGFHTREEAVKQGFTLGEKLGKKTASTDELLKFLYQASALNIMNKTQQMGLSDPPFKPSTENADLAKNEEKFMTECSYGQYLSGDFNKVPHLTGFTAFETVLFAGSIESVLDMVNFATNSVKILPESAPIHLPKTKSAAKALADGTMDLSSTLARELINETTDFLFVAGIDTKRKLLHQNSGHPVYYYRFSYDTYRSLHKLVYNINLTGTAHGDDFAYPFHMTLVDLPLDPNDPTYVTRKRMTRLWTNFAKYSDPTPHGKNDTLLQGITWPDTGDEIKYLEFGKDLSVGEDPLSTSAKIFKAADYLIFPVQTGCLGETLKKIASELNPLNSKTVRKIGSKIEDVASPIFSTIKKTL